METYARFEKSIVLVALLFNVLVTSFPKELSADVGALPRHGEQPRRFRRHSRHRCTRGRRTEHRGYKRPDRQTACVLDGSNTHAECKM